METGKRAMVHSTDDTSGEEIISNHKKASMHMAFESPWSLVKLYSHIPGTSLLADQCLFSFKNIWTCCSEIIGISPRVPFGIPQVYILPSELSIQTKLLSECTKLPPIFCWQRQCCWSIKHWRIGLVAVWHCHVWPAWTKTNQMLSLSLQMTTYRKMHCASLWFCCSLFHSFDTNLKRIWLTLVK